jgi:hypothetical protein
MAPRRSTNARTGDILLGAAARAPGGRRSRLS